MDIYEKFTKKMTSIGITVNGTDITEKALPCLTLCPWSAFKKQGFHFNLTGMWLWTFQLQILFNQLYIFIYF